MNKFKKGTAGITLVALVVTIVVLLILAGISLSLILGNYGVITKANEGRTNYANASVEEQEELNTAAEWMDNFAAGSELYTASGSSKTIKYGLQEDGITFITEPGEGLYPTDGKSYQPYASNSGGWTQWGEEFAIFIDNWTYYSYDIDGHAFDYCGPKSAD